MTPFVHDNVIVKFRRAEADVLGAMVGTVTELARKAAAGGGIAPAFVQPEARIADLDAPAERKLSKLFRVHREHEAFRAFCCDTGLLDLVAPLLGEELDCFLSQNVDRGSQPFATVRRRCERL